MEREEAIKCIRDFMGQLTEGCQEALKSAIPELAESEDERIRKRLIEYFEGFRIGNAKVKWEGLTVQDVLDWLEKQKGNPKSSDSIPSDCTSDAKCEDRWHKVTDSLPDNGRLVLAKDCLGNVLLARYDGENWEVNVYDNEDHYCHNSISKWCEIPSEKQKECLADNSKTSASDGERIRKEIYNFFKNFKETGTWKSISDVNTWLAYLEKQKEQKPLKVGENAYFDPNTEMWFIKKEQKPVSFYEHYNPDDYEVVIEGNATSLKKKEQKPAEWSDEDERYLNRVINLWVNDFGEDSDTVKWLKSLRPSWKPSEEQMEALRRAVNKLAKTDVADSVRLSIMYDNLKRN